MQVMKFYPKFRRSFGNMSVLQFRSNGIVYLSPLILRNLDAAGVDRKVARYRIDFMPESGMVRFVLDDQGYALNSGRHFFARRLISELPQDQIGKYLPASVGSDGSIECHYLSAAIIAE